MISLLDEGADLLGLTTDCLDVTLDFLLLGIETLFQLHLIPLAVAEAS